MIENFNPFISLGGDNQKVNHMAEAALEMNLTCNDLKTLESNKSKLLEGLFICLQIVLIASAP